MCHGGKSYIIYSIQDIGIDYLVLRTQETILSLYFEITCFKSIMENPH